MSEEITIPVPPRRGVASPKGRWAQRAERETPVFSIYPDPIPLTALGKSRFSLLI